MSTGSPFTRLAGRLRRQFCADGPFRNRGLPTGRNVRLRPSAVWTEAANTAAQAIAPAWDAVRGRWSRHVQPVLGVVSVLGWSVLAAAVLLWAAGEAYGWQEARAAALAALV